MNEHDHDQALDDIDYVIGLLDEAHSILAWIPGRPEGPVALLAAAIDGLEDWLV